MGFDFTGTTDVNDIIDLISVYENRGEKSALLVVLYLAQENQEALGEICNLVVNGQDEFTRALFDGIDFTPYFIGTPLKDDNEQATLITFLKAISGEIPDHLPDGSDAQVVLKQAISSLQPLKKLASLSK